MLPHGATKPCVQCILEASSPWKKRMGYECDHLSPFSAEFNVWTNVFVKERDNFTFYATEKMSSLFFKLWFTLQVHKKCVDK
jgi:hypothetical protein